MDFDNEDTVDDKTYINDMRDANDFRNISFSNYKKTEVKNILLDNILKYKIEPAIYWCAELLCSGHFMDIWEIALYIFGKHIHLGNPKLIVYLENRFKIFRNIISQPTYTFELEVRNNKKIRKLFAELMCVLTYSPRKHTIDLIKIDREEVTDIQQMTERLKATSVDFAKVIYEKEDPKELFIAMNEFSYHISKKGNPNIIRACYWIEWMIEFDSICKRKKQVCRCLKRDFIPNIVENKYHTDLIWMIWNSLLHYAKEDNHSDFVVKLLHSILYVFSIKYTSGSTKKRRYLLYFAVSLLIDPVPMNIELITQEHKNILAAALSQLHLIYLQIKHNEETPKTDYLFHNLEDQHHLPYNVVPPRYSISAPNVFGDEEDER